MKYIEVSENIGQLKHIEEKGNFDTFLCPTTFLVFQ